LWLTAWTREVKKLDFDFFELSSLSLLATLKSKLSKNHYIKLKFMRVNVPRRLASVWVVSLRFLIGRYPEKTSLTKELRLQGSGYLKT